MLLIHEVLLLVTLRSTLLFRRRQTKPTRATTFQELFDVLANVYESAAQLKPGWTELWHMRDQAALPPKYSIDNAMARDATHDMRFGTALLQRNRWKSIVEPLFADIDPRLWAQFVERVGPTSVALLDLRETRAELLLSDELDWIDDAIEHFDDVARRIRLATQNDDLLARQVAEGAYQYVYQAIRLSDRLIERLRFEAAQRK
jgi:hypothetical protein